MRLRANNLLPLLLVLFLAMLTLWLRHAVEAPSVSGAGGKGHDPDAIVDNFDYDMSVEEIAEQFEIPPELVEADIGVRQESPRCASCLIRTFQSVSVDSCSGMKFIPSWKWVGRTNSKTASF